ncbi:MAG: hypothetical protein FWF71_07400 [Actinomycetia bacterium]|nr:hypothetical protein [Actinomycetes bacterium]
MAPVRVGPQGFFWLTQMVLALLVRINKHTVTVALKSLVRCGQKHAFLLGL